MAINVGKIAINVGGNQSKKALRNKKRRRSCKVAKKPHHLDKINALELVLNYADSFRRNNYRSSDSNYIRKRMACYNSRKRIVSFRTGLLPLKRSRLIRRRRRCLGFVVHAFSPAYHSKTGVIQIQGANYAASKNMFLPLPVDTRVLAKMKRFWYSMSKNKKKTALWTYQGSKHGVYYQLCRKGCYWKAAMKVAKRYLGKKSKMNLLNHMRKAGYQLDHEYNCKDFEDFLSKVIGAKVKVMFGHDKITDTWYLNEIHILFNLKLEVIPYMVKKCQVKHTDKTTFVLESYGW